MKRAILPALMMALLLTGCGARQEERIEARRDALAEEEFCFTARTRTDLGDAWFDCDLAVEAGREGAAMTVTAPETIAGICVLVDGTGTRLECEELRFSLGAGLEDCLGPAEALPMLLEALTAGHVLRAWRERDGDTALSVAEFYRTDALTWSVWYTEETLIPLHAALRDQGREIFQCEITDWTEG